jgi:Phage virion morphogenesis family
MNSAVKIELKNFDEGVERLRILTLPAEKRKRYLRRMLGKARSLARQNVKAQREVDGSPFVPRQEKKRAKWGTATGERIKKAKLLWNLAKAKLLNIRVDDYEASIRYQNPVTGKIAARHHYGGWETIKTKVVNYKYACDPKNKKTKPLFKIGCNMFQACMLCRLGYTDKNGSRPNWRQIMKTVTAQQAAFAIDKLKEAAGIRMKVTRVHAPARPFFGMTSAQFWEAHDEVWPTINKHWGRGRRRA